MLTAEVLDYSGLTHFVEPRWWNVGYAKLQGEDLNYLSISGLRIAGNQGILIIAICQVRRRPDDNEEGQSRGSTLVIFYYAHLSLSPPACISQADAEELMQKLLLSIICRWC